MLKNSEVEGGQYLRFDSSSVKIYTHVFMHTQAI